MDSTIEIDSIHGLKGTFRPPGDKSISHRALMLGALANGESRIEGLLEAQDIIKTIEALQSLGVKIEESGGIYRVLGREYLREPDGILDMGNSGTGMRLLAGILAGERGCYSLLTGDSSLLTRPMDRIVEPLKAMGASILGRRGDTLPPLSIKGEALTAIEYQLPIPSAQVKSALLFAGLRVDGRMRIFEPVPCRDHTERMMISMGIPLMKRDKSITLEGPVRPKPFQLSIPGDISSAAFLVVAALITRDSSLAIKGVGLNPTRSAYLKVLQEMGGKIIITERGVEAGEPVGDLYVESSHLQGLSILGERIPLLIDEIPALVAAAVLAKGETHIGGALELRHKESDRIRSLVQEFTRMGAHIEELPDGMRIIGREDLLGGVECESHLDHRIGMALAVAGLASKDGVRIKGGESIGTSFPGFLQVLETLSKN